MAYRSGKRSAAMDGVIVGMRQLSVADLEDEVDDVLQFDAGNYQAGVEFPAVEPVRRRRSKRFGCCLYLSVLLAVLLVIVVWKFGRFALYFFFLVTSLV